MKASYFKKIKLPTFITIDLTELGKKILNYPGDGKQMVFCIIQKTLFSDHTKIYGFFHFQFDNMDNMTAGEKRPSCLMIPGDSKFLLETCHPSTDTEKQDFLKEMKMNFKKHPEFMEKIQKILEKIEK